MDCSLLGSTATLIRPSRLGHCIYCWKVTIAVYVRKDATSSQNMGRLGPGLVSPGHFGLILVSAV